MARAKIQKLHAETQTDRCREKDTSQYFLRVCIVSTFLATVAAIVVRNQTPLQKTLCPVGFYSAPSTECLPCPSGTYGDAIGLQVCKFCAPGTFSPKRGQAACTPCAPGYFVNYTGSAGCDPCAKNTFTNETGSVACKKCAPRFKTIGVGSNGCVLKNKEDPKIKSILFVLCILPLVFNKFSVYKKY